VATGRQIPVTVWSATSRWRASPLTLAVLFGGLWLFGTAEALVVDARIGNSPWTVLAEGVSARTPLSIGAATFVISAVILLGWVPLRERPGLGTLANAVIIAVALGVGVAHGPRPRSPIVQLAQAGAGTVLVGLAGALYLTANLGPGPRDGLMTGLHARFGWPVAGVRTVLEVCALGVGWLLGGKVGVGTAIFALGIGPALAWFLRRLPVRDAGRGHDG
jgi:hypothetical protein